MMIPTRTIPPAEPHRTAKSWSPRERWSPHSTASQLNTLEQALRFARAYSAEIRQDAKARRIYRSFFALTNNQFDALLAFSIWKVRGNSFSFR